MRIFEYTFILFLFAICTVSSVPNANAQFLTYRTISTEDGLSSDAIHIVMQDSKGYVWIGTKNGLLRWDSQNFKWFTIADGLPNNEVLSLYEDSKGRMWISSFSQEPCYYFNGQIYNKRNAPALSKIRTYPGSKFVECNDVLYYNSIDTKLSKFDLIRQKATAKGYGTLLIFAQRGNKVWGIHEERNVSALMSMNKKYLITSDDSSYYSSYPLYPNIPDIDIVTSIDFQNTWYGFSYGVDTPFYKAKYTDTTFRYALYNKGNILEVYKKFLVVKPDNYQIKVEYNNGPQIFAVNKIIYMVNNSGLLFCRQMPILEYEQKPEINNNAKFIFKYKNGVYAVNNDYQLIDVAHQTIANQLKNNAINLYNMVSSENGYYIATSFNVHYFTDPKGPINIFPRGDVFNFKFINKSSKKDFFFAANGHRFGIYLINFKNNACDTLMDDISKVVYSVYEDSKARLWYSTNDKVYYTYHYSKKVKNSKEFKLDTINPVFCKSIQEDRKGNLFFMTNGGVFVYDGKRKYRIDQTNLLSDNECNKLVIDNNRECFWVATKNGVNQIAYKQDSKGMKFEVWSKFFASDGLRSNNINDLLLDSNKIYIATDKGVNILDDVNYRPDTQRIPIYIKLNTINAIGKRFYDTLNNIELKYDQNNLTIGFSALYFLRRDRLKTKAYLYRNNSLISQSEITEDKIDYYSLNDGKYKLIIYAYDQDYRYIHGKSVPFVFIINPPYYKTWWFIIGSSLIVIITTMSIALWNINRRKKRAIQQAELHAKLNESTLKSLQSQMNPHFVFNSLNTIQSFITEKNEEGAIDYLSDFSGLMREILEQSVHSFISLENEIHFLEHYLRLEMTRYKDSFDVVWDIDLQEDDLTDIYIPTMLIQPILENAVKHGVSNLINTKGHINITVELVRENLLKVTVKDNGKLSAKGSFKGNSIAVQTIKDRLNIYTKNNEKGVYTLQVSDEGAIATITIPI